LLPEAALMPLAHDGAARAFADVGHLGARIGLLAVVRHRYAVELAGADVALEHTARVFPGDR
jgi:hypothetical protein